MKNCKFVKPLNIMIIGRGSIGSLLAAQLAPFHNIAFYLRDKSLTNTCFTITATNGLSKSFSFNAVTETELRQIDFIVCCVKSYQVADALKPIGKALHQIQRTIPIILCHNGMVTDSTLRKVIPRSTPLYTMLTTHGCLKKATNHFVHTGLGRFDIGAISKQERHNDDRADKFSAAIKQSIVEPVNHFFWRNDITVQQWQKLAINCVINPLTAIHNVKNGVLADHKFKSQIRAIIEEVTKVAQASGIPLTRNALTDAIYQVIEGTANNYSSMHQDIVHNRPTEIDFISGFIVAQGSSLNIETPANKEMLELIKQKHV